MLIKQKSGVQTRHLCSFGGMSISSSDSKSNSKANSTCSLDFIYHSTGKKYRLSNTNPSSSNSNNKSIHNKKHNSINGIENFLIEAKNYETKRKNSSSKNRIALSNINDFSNRKQLFQENLNNISLNNKILNNQNNKKIYAKEYFEFQNEVTHKIHYVKKFKEDDISFTKSNILPEIQWQQIDNDVLTSEDQKKNAHKKEMNWLTETVKLVQSNDKYLKNHLFMYKMSKKYPK